MTEQDVIKLLQCKKKYEVEIAILRDCSDSLFEVDESNISNRYALLNRRVSLIKHWLEFLSPEERYIVEMRLIKQKTWSSIAEHIQNSTDGTLACDERTIQRQLDRAVGKLYRFMNKHFGSSLDFLIDESEKES